MKLEAESYVFVLRFNENYIIDAMEIHKDICMKRGDCWYGKAGKKPNMNRIMEFIGDGIKMLFYSRNKIYICDLINVSFEKPNEGYPDYYDNSMWKPNTWFQIKNLMRVNKDILDELLVMSTEKTMTDTINSSMTSFFFTKVRRNIELEEEDYVE